MYGRRQHTSHSSFRVVAGDPVPPLAVARVGSACKSRSSSRVYQVGLGRSFHQGSSSRAHGHVTSNTNLCHSPWCALERPGLRLIASDFRVHVYISHSIRGASSMNHRHGTNSSADVQSHGKCTCTDHAVYKHRMTETREHARKGGGLAGRRAEGHALYRSQLGIIAAALSLCIVAQYSKEHGGIMSNPPIRCNRARGAEVNLNSVFAEDASRLVSQPYRWCRL